MFAGGIMQLALGGYRRNKMTIVSSWVTMVSNNMSSIQLKHAGTVYVSKNTLINSKLICSTLVNDDSILVKMNIS